MKKLICYFFPVLVAGASANAQPAVSTQPTFSAMKLNAGIVTPHLAETRAFYTEQLGFGITFENEWYLLLHTPGGASEISFLKPDLPDQAAVFRPAFQGQGVYLTIETADVDALFHTLQEKGIPVLQPLRDEPWGDRHFVVMDPNGIGIDFVRYQAP